MDREKSDLRVVKGMKQYEIKILVRIEGKDENDALLRLKDLLLQHLVAIITYPREETNETGQMLLL